MNIRSYSPGRFPAALERGDIKKQEDKMSESKYTPVVQQETAQANARLIAAAPDMLAALKKMSEAVSLLRDGERNGAAFGMVGIAHDEARETIAKAEGK